jgi:sugar O-acyltransferase (sialic acid O-acetyltransferase NeuD family)
VLNKEIVLVGYSGHGLVVADAALSANMNLKYFTDKSLIKSNPFNLIHLGFEADLEYKHWDKNYHYILGIGNNNIRNKAAELLKAKGVAILNVIHPSVSKSERIQFGYGNFISRNVLINTLVKIGNNCILNTGCIIEHECIVGNGVHIGPGAVLSGNVEVGDNSFIGANSVIKQGVKIGSNVIIGAGTVVLNNVSDNRKLVGNPGREI